MTGRVPQGAVDWGAIGLVVFDMDGTLYDQRRLRLRMARALLTDAARRRSLADMRTLACFRRCREELAEEGAVDFHRAQYARTAAITGRPATAVRRLVADWMEERPLPHLAAARRPGVERVFAALRAARVPIAILSDYPAGAKLDALGLTADLIVCAGDPGVSRLKPDPAGLRHILRETGVAAGRALMIGDRADRDAAAAAAAGVPALIRSVRPIRAVATFRRYDDAVFRPLIDASAQRRMAAVA